MALLSPLFNSLGWIVALLLVFWFILSVRFALPHLLVSRNLGAMQIGFIEQNASREFTSIPPPLESAFAGFRSLGFVPLGIKFEKFPLWGPRLEEYSLASDEARAFASLLSFSRLNYTGSYLLTPFTNGAIVFTTTNPRMSPIEAPGFSLKVMAGATPEQALADHRVRVGRFEERGLTPYPSYDRQSRLAATRAFYAAAPIERSMRLGARGHVGMILLPLLLLGVFLLSVLIWQ